MALLKSAKVSYGQNTSFSKLEIGMRLLCTAVEPSEERLYIGEQA
jgi:hypothetical protein